MQLHQSNGALVTDTLALTSISVLTPHCCASPAAQLVLKGRPLPLAASPKSVSLRGGQVVYCTPQHQNLAALSYTFGGGSLLCSGPACALCADC